MNFLSRLPRSVVVGGGAVLVVLAVVAVWQAVAQFIWSIDPHRCTYATNWSACQAAPAREYTDFMAYFDDTAFNMIWHYLLAFATAAMIALVIVAGICGYGWTSDFYRYKVLPFVTQRQREGRHEEADRHLCPLTTPYPARREGLRAGGTGFFSL